MKKFAIVLLAACGGGHADTSDLFDGPVARMDARQCGEGACSLLTQAGCNTGEKCAWVHATDPVGSQPGLGAISCVAVGTAALGEACLYSPVDLDAPGSCNPTSGYDNCVAGTACQSGICKQICDNQGGAPSCPAAETCVTYDGLFANEGSTTIPAGVCEPTCNPLDDNDFDGSGTRFTKAGSACGGDPTKGCYGLPSSTHTTVFQCSAPAAGTELLTHRSLIPDNQHVLNACMPGYEIGVVYDTDLGVQIDCLAWCAPGDSYLGATAQHPNGLAPHRCNPTDALGNFGATPDGSATSNGEHCAYSWIYELDSTSSLHRSPTSDTVGICVDHTKYHYDSNGNGMIDAGDAVMPPCAALPVHAATGPDASDLGCVSTTTAGQTFDSKQRLRLGIQLPELIDLPRPQRH